MLVHLCVGSGRLSKRRVIRFVVLGAAAVTLAGYSAYAKRDEPGDGRRAGGQLRRPNRRTADFQPRRQDRQAAVQTALTDAAAQRSYTLASVQPDIELERPANPVIAATPSIPATEPAPVAEPKAAEAKTAALAPRIAKLA